jgi:hypothetical protein
MPAHDKAQPPWSASAERKITGRRVSVVGIEASAPAMLLADPAGQGAEEQQVEDTVSVA